jgi:ABC-type nitrate/sulfonate/bicarbonate transport system substrate-binding protein
LRRISTPGSESDVAAALALRQLGLTRTDVSFVPAGTTVARAEALLGNQIAATALNEPVSNVAELRGLPKLVDLDGTTPWILNGIVLRKSAVGQNRALVLAFLKAYIEAIHYALANPQETQAILSARYGMLEPAVAQATYEDFRQRIPRDAAPSVTAAENMIRELPALGTQVGSTNASDYVDLSYIEELRRDGTIAALQAKYGTQ